MQRLARSGIGHHVVGLQAFLGVEGFDQRLGQFHVVTAAFGDEAGHDGARATTGAEGILIRVNAHRAGRHDARDAAALRKGQLRFGEDGHSGGCGRHGGHAEERCGEKDRWTCAPPEVKRRARDFPACLFSESSAHRTAAAVAVDRNNFDFNQRAGESECSHLHGAARRLVGLILCTKELCVSGHKSGRNPFCRPCWGRRQGRHASGRRRRG